MTPENTDRRLNGSHPKAGVAVVAKQKNYFHCRKLNTSRAAFCVYLLPYHHINKTISIFTEKFITRFFETDPYLLSIADTNEKFTK
jgi:hypothetical protein